MLFPGIGSGMAGLLVEDSIVVDETPTNHESSVLNDPQSATSKYTSTTCETSPTANACIMVNYNFGGHG